MAVLQYTLSDLKRELSAYLHDSRATIPAGGTTEILDFINRGYLEFLAEREWSFLTQTGTLTVATGDTAVDLPANFSAMDGSFHFDTTAPTITETGVNEILELLASSDYSTGTPYQFAIRQTGFTVTGSRYEVLFYPLAGSTMTLDYQYDINPVKLENNTDVPIGGPKHAPAILASCLKVAEESTGKTKGVMAERYERRLAASVLRDGENEPSNLGQIRCDSDYFSDDEVDPHIFNITT